MISVPTNPIVQSNPVSRHVVSTNWTGLLRFNHRFRHSSPEMFPLTIPFTVPFRLLHILGEFHLLLLNFPLFLLFLCIYKTINLETFLAGEWSEKKRSDKKLPEERHERRTCWSSTSVVWFPENWRETARNRAVVEKTMAVAITTPWEQLSIQVMCVLNWDQRREFSQKIQRERERELWICTF